jgi:hypothetical protein
VANYEIRLSGIAGPVVRAALEEFDVEVDGETTTVRADLPDQAALHGLIDRLRDLGVEIIEVRRIDVSGAST